MKKLFSLLTLLLTLSAAGALEAQTATVSTDKSSLTFSAQVGGTAQSQPLTINNAGSSSFTAISSAAWVKLNGQTSLGLATPSTVTVTADPTGLSAGNYLSSITILGTSGPSISV